MLAKIHRSGGANFKEGQANKNVVRMENRKEGQVIKTLGVKAVIGKDKK
jgi:hypothetical protein